MSTKEESNCLNPYLIHIWDIFTVPINGYLSNVVVLVTMVTNCFVCLVLLKQSMRSATNVILVAMAMSTTLSGMWRVPGDVYFFTLDGYKDWVPYNWCFFYYNLARHLPTVFHTASVWLTVALAVQRYFYVCHSQRTKRWCTVANSVRAAVIIHVFAAALHFTRFFERLCFPVVVPSKVDPARNVNGCCLKYNLFAERDPGLYFIIYSCIEVVLVQLVPFTALVLLSALLIHTMCTAHVRREVLLSQESESRRLAESDSTTTMMLVAIVGVFLLVELPLTVVYILFIVDYNSHLMVLDYDQAIIALHFIDLFILLSYPTYFFIYTAE